ncbi:glutathione peroxidase [Ornithinimicrobium sp. W1679]|uniref:glutathione peroxidase n=1 Tax=Ornithinimicrobium sp. W1679 TaxID=3418770 RepID=UPI003CF9A2D8
MTLHDIPLTTLDGRPTTLGEHAGRVLLVANVASRCGLTPQYAGLEQLQEEYGDRGLTVVGVPCNQFGGQEPGTNEEIAQFCSATYGVSFPMMDKVDVNGEDRHPLFDELTQVRDGDGEAGDVGWNFEKWVVDGDGAPVARFRSRTEPTDPQVVETIEAALAGA